MLRNVLRKMLKTRWMILCLLIGVVIAASMLSSIPQYTGGILQKVLTKDLENYQVANNIFSGTYYVSCSFGVDASRNVRQKFASLNSLMYANYKALNLSALWKVNTLSCGEYQISIEDSPLKSLDLDAMTDMENHVKMIYGHYPSQEKNGDAYEVMIDSSAMHELGLNSGATYEIENTFTKGAPPLKVIIAGVFEPKSPSDSYWPRGQVSFPDDLFFNYNIFLKDFGNKNNYQITGSEWYEALDYHKITIENIDGITSALESQQNSLIKNEEATSIIPALDILQTYNARAKQLQTVLWVLEAPVIIMLIFYLFMVAQLIMEKEKNEIAVLKSRGASRSQIFRTYFMESLILGGFALIFGPLIGLWMSRALGASNGFLEFVQRTSLHIKLNPTSYLYALMAIGIFIVTMLVPAFFASKSSIVIYKQEKRKKNTVVFWKKYFLDFLLLGISGYGIYSYHMRMKLMTYSVGSANDLPIDPLLLLISTLFILGAGLVFVRVYPFIVKFIFWIGKRFWKPSAYASLLYVSRSGGMDQFLILFLILAISIGIFNATAARTINTNTEEKAKYAAGADITMLPAWEAIVPADDDSASPDRPTAPDKAAAASSTAPAVQYIEPDYNLFQSLSGVGSVTKVFKTSSASVSLKSIKSQQSLINSSGQVTLNTDKTVVNYMAIIPSEFGKIAWFRTDLLPYHWFNYLNVLTKEPQGVLVSRAFQKDFGVKLGDEIPIDVSQGTTLMCNVYAFVDYWPTCNPNVLVNGKKQPYFIVGNLNYFQSIASPQPYEIWIKKKAGATSKQLYNDIEAKKLKILSFTDVSQDIVKSKNDPILEGINGSLTLSFLLAMMIVAVGFLIYWIMSIRGRVLQFGILRAMGLTFRELIQMLLLEQLLISVISILVGVGIGCLTSRIFVPMLAIAFTTSDLVPPFKTVAYVGDYLKIFAIMALMLAGGLAVLSAMISKIKINQAIKLGED